MMSRTAWVGMLALLFQASASAGNKEDVCHLQEPQVFGLMTQNENDSERSRRNGGVGGTGIVAEITSTSPLRIAGCKVEVTASTAILDEQAPMSLDKLARGQRVYALLDHQGGHLQAKSIVVQHILEGEVTRVGADHSLEIMGKKVLVVPGQTQYSSTAPSSLSGKGVKVSGFRLPDGSVIASRVDTYRRLEAAGVMGRLEQNGTAHTVGGVEVTSVPDAEMIGSVVSVLGRWHGNRIEASEFGHVGWLNGKASPRWMLFEGQLRQGEQLGLVDGPNLNAPDNIVYAGLRENQGGPVSVFGALLPDGSIQVQRFWKK